MAKYTYEEVKQCFQARDYTLLSTEYINNNTKLQYQCPNGHIGETRFRSFQSGRGCKVCGFEKMVETIKLNNNGVHHFQTPEFLEKRKQKFIENYGVDSPLKSTKIKTKREHTNLNRYGVKHVSHDPNIRNKQKQGLKNKYGFEYTMQIPTIKEKFKQTLLKNHGVPNLAYLSRCCSKESQKLFWEIHNKLPAEIIHKSHFAELNNEFVIGPTPEYFKYDFVNSIIKKCIEYNGYNFHPRPEQLEDEINWKIFHPNTTVKEAREYETKKLESIQNRGYSVLVVWDYELHKDFNALVDKCMDFLMPKNL